MRNMMAACLVVASMIGLSQEAAGSPIFQAGVVISPGCAAVDGALRCVSDSSSGAVSVGAGPFIETQGPLDVALGASASAAPGILMAEASASSRTPTGAFAPFTVFDSARASFSLDDVLVTGPAGESAPISFDIGVAGGLTTERDPSMSASASVRVSYSVGSSFGGFSADLGAAMRADGVYTGSGTFASGIAGGLTTPWMVRSGDIVTFSLGLDVGSASGCGSFGCPPDSDAFGLGAFGAVGFTRGALVALLPPGWTIDSPSGEIVDSRFVGGTPVPEPGTMSLLAFGIVSLGGLRLRLGRR